MDIYDRISKNIEENPEDWEFYFKDYKNHIRRKDKTLTIYIEDDRTICIQGRSIENLYLQSVVDSFIKGDTTLAEIVSKW